MKADADLQIFLSFQKFRNLDLFERGYYRYTCKLLLPDSPTAIVKAVPTTFKSKLDDIEILKTLAPNNYCFPSSVDEVENVFKSTVFFIRYKKESVILEDDFLFQINVPILELERINKELANINFQLIFSLEYLAELDSDENKTEYIKNAVFKEVSSRVLRFRYSTGNNSGLSLCFKSLHYCTLDFTIHSYTSKIGFPIRRTFRDSFGSFFDSTRDSLYNDTNFLIPLTTNFEKALYIYRYMVFTLIESYELLFDSFNNFSDIVEKHQRQKLSAFGCLNEALTSKKMPIVDDSYCNSAIQSFAEKIKNKEMTSDQLKMLISKDIQTFFLKVKDGWFLYTEHIRNCEGLFNLLSTENACK